MQIFNALTQEKEDVVFSVDPNGELIATFNDGHFLKFPAGTTEEELSSLVDEHDQVNADQEVITPEMEAEKEAQFAAAEELASKLNGDKTNDSSNDQPSE